MVPMVQVELRLVDEVQGRPPVAVDMTLAGSDTESAASLPQSQAALSNRSEDDVSLHHAGEDSDLDGVSVASGEAPAVPEVDVPLEVPEVRDVSPAIRDAFRRMDGCDVERIFLRRPIVMNGAPMCIRGPYRAAMRVALVEATSEAHIQRARGWKLSLLLPRMLLSRPPCGGLVSQEKLHKRFEMFAGGRWEELLRDSEAQEATAATLRRRRRSDNVEDRRVSKALGLVQMGELSAGRAASEAAELARGDATLQQLQDPVRRLPRAREPIPEHFLTEMPVAQFDMEEHKFLENLRSARKGVAPGPSGMTCEHLRPLFENSSDSHRFFLVAE